MKNACNKRRKSRAIVLITTLAIMTFLVMIATMLITTSYNSLRRASSYYWTSAAQQTAIAGAVFAQTCLESDFGWMATRKPGTIVGPTMVGNIQVTQNFDKQTVQGFIFPATPNAGCITEFRISFNPASTFPNDNTVAAYTSCNNLSSDTLAYTLENGNNSRSVPKRTVDVIVEGIARATFDGSVLGRRRAEVGFYRDLTSLINLAASGGNMVADVDPAAGNWTVQMASGLAGNPGIRSMANVQLYANDASQFTSTAGSIHLINGTGTAVNLPSSGTSASLSPVDNSLNARQNAENFARITFDQVKVPTSNTLSAGTYVYWDKTSSTPTYYKDLVYTPSKDTLSYEFDPDAKSVTVTDTSTTPAAKKTYAASGSAIVPSGFFGAMTVNINGAIDVQPTMYKDAAGNDVTNKSVAIVADPTITDQRLAFNFQGSSGSVLQNSNDGGNITLRGEVNGSGAVQAKGDISFEGHSALSPNPNAVVTMYSGGNTSLDPILNTVSSVDTKSKSTKAPTGSPTGIDATGAAALFVLGYTQARLDHEASVVASGGTPLGTMPGVTYNKTSATTVSASFNPSQLTAQGNLAEALGDIIGEYNGETHGTNPDGYSDTIKYYLGQAGMTMADVSNQLLALGNQLGYTGSDHDRITKAAGYIIQQSSTQSPTDATVRNWTYSTATGQLEMTTTGSAWKGDQQPPAEVEVTDAKGNKKTVTAADQEFYGMIYACGNFSTNMPHTANVSLQGAIVAYGGDPSKFNGGDSSTYPGANGQGKMIFTGKNVTFTYDPTYLGGLYNLFPCGQLTRSFFASF